MNGHADQSNEDFFDDQDRLDAAADEYLWESSAASLSQDALPRNDSYQTEEIRQTPISEKQRQRLIHGASGRRELAEDGDWSFPKPTGDRPPAYWIYENQEESDPP